MSFARAVLPIGMDANDRRYAAYRKRMLGTEAAARVVQPSSVRTDPSPSGEYEIEASSYGDGTNAWQYSRGIVRKVASGEVVADLRRNMAPFWHRWVQHPNGREYLICSEDYQTYTVLNVGAKRHVVTFPPEAEKGGGFCWLDAHPSPDGSLLAVDGCYWACPYQLVLFDFREPERRPLPELARIDGLWSWGGWTDACTFEFHRSYDVRASDGADLSALSQEELEQLPSGGTREVMELARGQWDAKAQKLAVVRAAI